MIGPLPADGRPLDEAAFDPAAEAAARWRLFGLLYLAACLFGDTAALLRIGSNAHVAALLSLAVVSVLAAGSFVVFARRLPVAEGWLSAALAFGTVDITFCIVADNRADSPWVMFYAFAVFIAFFVLGGRVAVAHLALIAVAYGVALIVTPGSGYAPVSTWIIAVTTIASVGLLADTLNERRSRLVARLRQTARVDPLTRLSNRRAFDERLPARSCAAGGWVRRSA